MNNIKFLKKLIIFYIIIYILNINKKIKMECIKNINSNGNNIFQQIGIELHQIIKFIQANSENLENLEAESDRKRKWSKNDVKLGKKRRNSIELDEHEDENNVKENKKYKEDKEIERIVLKNKKLKEKIKEFKRYLNEIVKKINEILIKIIQDKIVNSEELKINKKQELK